VYAAAPFLTESGWKRTVGLFNLSNPTVSLHVRRA
jgi:hypothetical protein